MFALLFAAFGPTALISQTPNFLLLDRSIVSVKVTCSFKPDDPADEACSDRATGIVLSERDGFARVLTARHEVHGINSNSNAKVELTFAFDQLKPMPAKLLSISNEQLDLAILEVELPKGATGFGSVPLVWVPQSEVKEGMPLWVVDGRWSPLEGKIAPSVLDPEEERVRYFCRAANGYSGGPVFDDAGRLVAIHLRSRSELAPDLRDGVTLDAALKWLKSIGYEAESFNRLIVRPLGAAGTNTQALDASSLRPLSIGDRGTLLYRAGHYNEAKPFLTEAANVGDGHAAELLSETYLGVQGVPVDYAEANRWAKIGAIAGNEYAMGILGASYSRGIGVEQNSVLSAYWFRLSAERGNAESVLGLALLFMNGQINADATTARIPKHQETDTDIKAVYWLQRASDAGHLQARALLGFMFGNGRGGLAKDDARAVQLFRSSAKEGNEMGMRLLGDWYLTGRVNGQRDFRQAVFWYKSAASLGDEFSKQQLRKIAAANPQEQF